MQAVDTLCICTYRKYLHIYTDGIAAPEWTPGFSMLLLQTNILLHKSCLSESFTKNCMGYFSSRNLPNAKLSLTNAMKSKDAQ